MTTCLDAQAVRVGFGIRATESRESFRKLISVDAWAQLTNQETQRFAKEVLGEGNNEDKAMNMNDRAEEGEGT